MSTSSVVWILTIVLLYAYMLHGIEIEPTERRLFKIVMVVAQ